MPQRIQLRRTKGWRKPEGAVVVARPTKWGNPFDWDSYPKYGDGEDVPDSTRRGWAVTDFEMAVVHRIPALSTYPSLDEIRMELRGHDLACWCPLDDLCHADVLLELANGPVSE